MPAANTPRRPTPPRRVVRVQHVPESAEAQGDSPGKAIKKASGVLKKEARKK